MAAAEETQKKGMDPLKAYCLVLGFLCVVLGYLWIRIRSERIDYEEAMVRAEALLGEKGGERTVDGRPVTIPGLAYEVEQFVVTFKGTSQDGDVTTGIPLEMMQLVAKHAGVVQEQAGNERVDQNRSAGYETRSREFDYKPTTLKNLLALVWNVDTRGRFRVNEVRWQLADTKDNSQPPFHAVTKPRIKVAVRAPIQKER